MLMVGIRYIVSIHMESTQTSFVCNRYLKSTLLPIFWGKIFLIHNTLTKYMIFFSFQ